MPFIQVNRCRSLLPTVSCLFVLAAKAQQPATPNQTAPGAATPNQTRSTAPTTSPTAPLPAGQDRIDPAPLAQPAPVAGTAPAAPGTQTPAAQAPGVPVTTPGNAAPGNVASAGQANKNNDVLPARGTYQVTGNANALSVFAVSVDAQELFTALASKANLRLVVDDTVSRKLTVNILNKSARQVVGDIVSAYGLSVADVDGVTMISEGIPRSPSSYLLSDIDSIPTKYVDAANARNLLPVFLQDYVKVNGEQNAVVLSAPAEVLQKFREDIQQFDIPASQILVDLLLVELTDTDSDQLGLNLSEQNAGKGFGLNASNGSVVFHGITTLPRQFSANLQALQQQGKARVRANPRIATVSGRRANVFVGRQRYIATPIDTNNGRGQSNFIDAGVRLGITPNTGGQGTILVDVDAEVSTLSAPDPVTNLPEKSTRTAGTTIRVRNGQTIVIGGLKQQETSNVRTRVPVLGSIPILGPLLFQTKSIRTTQTELVLFITPRILSDTGHLPAAEEQTLKQNFLNSDLNRPLPPAGPITLQVPGAIGIFPDSNPTIPLVAAPSAPTTGKTTR